MWELINKVQPKPMATGPQLIFTVAGRVSAVPVESGPEQPAAKPRKAKAKG